MASIAVTFASKEGLISSSFNLSEESMDRLYKAIQFSSVQDFDEEDKNLDKPEPISPQEICDLIAKDFAHNLLTKIYRLEVDSLVKSQKLGYLELTKK